MVYIHSDSSGQDSSLWFFHLPTFTLAELHLGALPGACHLLTVEAGQPPPDEAFKAFANYLESMSSGASDNLALRTRSTGSPLPEYLILVPSASNLVSCIIYYPVHGLVAGIRADGTKIAPIWKEPNYLQSANRNALLKQAAETLIRALSNLGDRQE